MTAQSAQIFAALEAAKKQAGGDACRVIVSPTDVFLNSGIVQPDLLVGGDPSKLSARCIEGAPDLVEEILSPGTAQKDWTTKRWAYEGAGVPEVLIVDPDERVGVLLRLEVGRYVEAVRVAWVTAVAVLGGRMDVTPG